MSGQKIPPVGDDKHDFKKELKGRLVIVVVRKTNTTTSSSPLSNTIDNYR